MGYCWSCLQNRKKNTYESEIFLAKRLPIFWVMGPANCGKSTLASMLAMSSKYQLIKVSKIIKEEGAKNKYRSKIIADCIKRGQPVYNDIVIALLQEVLYNTQTQTRGYIIDGFPLTMKQAGMFEIALCKPNMIIYVTLILDTLLGRLLAMNGNINIDKARQRHINMANDCHRIYRKYEVKTLKVVANYPPEDTCTKLVTDLEDFWGYKFERLFNKN